MAEIRINNIIKDGVLSEIQQVIDNPKHSVDEFTDQLFDRITQMINQTEDKEDLEQIQEQIDEVLEMVESLESAAKNIQNTLESRSNALFDKRF
jgi:uncharacterized protein (UPF0305 family)